LTWGYVFPIAKVVEPFICALLFREAKAGVPMQNRDDHPVVEEPEPDTNGTWFDEHDFDATGDEAPEDDYNADRGSDYDEEFYTADVSRSDHLESVPCWKIRAVGKRTSD
jgi:hypothetical protein